MEKIKITEIKEVARPGKATFWGCKLSDGREATVWDADIAERIENNLNVESEAEVKAQGTFNNIRKFVGGENTVTSESPAVQEQPKGSVMSDKEKGMCAGGMLKCWYYNHTAEHPDEILAMYRKFLKEL